MLFAVEGGFFSSSASGYSSGLALLFLGQKNEERNMKVSPWNQYQLVHDLNLASAQNEVLQGCSSFTCFGCGSSSDERSFHPKTTLCHHYETSTEISSDRAKLTVSVSPDENKNKIRIKSSLKKPSPTNCCVAYNSMEEKVQSNISFYTGRRKVQWSDSCGKELTEIREFELSDDGLLEDGIEDKHARRCECVIQ